MIPTLAAGILLLLAPPASRGAGPTSAPPAGAVVPVPTPAPAVAPTFEELWSAYVEADAADDAPAAARALREIRRVRMERNVPSLDTVGLGLVERGVAKLDAKDREAAEGAFRTAVALAPGLPDGHAGLSVALLKKGPFGVVPSIDAAVSGVSAFLADRARAPQRPRPRDGGRPPRDLRDRVGDCPGPARAPRRPPASRSRRVAGPRPGPLRLAGALPPAAPPARGDLPGVGLAAPCGGSRSSLPTSTHARGRSPASSSRRRWRWGRSSLRSTCGCAPRATRCSTPRSPRWSRLPTRRRSRGSRRRRAATRRTAISPTCSAPPEGAPAGTRRRPSCTGSCSRPIPRTRSRGTTSRTSSSCAGSYDAARARYRAGTEAGARRRGRGHLVLQPVARPPPEVRVPGLQRGEVERGPARPRAGGRLRPVEVRLARLRGGGPRPDPRAGPGQVRRERVGGGGAERRRGGAATGAGGDPRRLPGESLRRVGGGVRARRVPRRALARAEGVHAPLRPVRDGLLPLLPPGAGERGPLLAVLPPVRGAGRGLRPGAQPQDGRGAASGRAPGAGLPGALGPLPRRGAGLRRLDAARRGAARGLVRRPGPGRGPMGGALHGSAEAPVAAVAGGGGRVWCSSGSWLAANRFRPESDVALPARPAGPRRARVAKAAG